MVHSAVINSISREDETLFYYDNALNGVLSFSFPLAPPSQSRSVGRDSLPPTNTHTLLNRSAVVELLLLLGLRGEFGGSKDDYAVGFNPFINVLHRRRRAREDGNVLNSSPNRLTPKVIHSRSSYPSSCFN